MTIPEMVALVRVANSTPTIHGYATDAHFEAAVTAAERLAKALREHALAGRDYDANDYYEVQIPKVVMAQTEALLDDLYPNWRG